MKISYSLILVAAALIVSINAKTIRSANADAKDCEAELQDCKMQNYGDPTRCQKRHIECKKSQAATSAQTAGTQGKPGSHEPPK